MVILYQLDIAKDQKLNVSIDDTIKANVEVEEEDQASSTQIKNIIKYLPLNIF